MRAHTVQVGFPGRARGPSGPSGSSQDSAAQRVPNGQSPPSGDAGAGGRLARTDENRFAAQDCGALTPLLFVVWTEGRKRGCPGSRVCLQGPPNVEAGGSLAAPVFDGVAILQEEPRNLSVAAQNAPSLPRATFCPNPQVTRHQNHQLLQDFQGALPPRRGAPAIGEPGVCGRWQWGGSPGGAGLGPRGSREPGFPGAWSGADMEEDPLLCSPALWRRRAEALGRHPDLPGVLSWRHPALESASPRIPNPPRALRTQPPWSLTP